MGLSGRKEKQRIGADPRNLTWADDAAKFGSNYLSKFGWDSSKGLGADGEGRISHIKVSQKLDMLGIGAAQQKDPNGIAWKQNKDFERLLERLNAEQEVKAEAEDADEKKRKREDGDDTVVKKKRRKSEPVAEVVAVVEAVRPLVPRHRAHRARAIAAKNIASKSAASISEILGIAPTPSASAPATPQGKLTAYDDEVPLEKLTTSTLSVADYFKDKLLAKVGKSGSATPTPSEAIKAEIDYDDAPRGGLGSARVKLEAKDEDPPMRMGLGLSKLSSMMASSFSAASTSLVATEEVTVKLEEEDLKVDKKKKRKSPDDEDTGKRKDKKGKRREVENSDSVLPDTESTEKKAMKHRRRDDEGEEDASKVDAEERKRAKKEKKQVMEEDASTVEPVDEEERKRAKKEKKRLKALKKEQAVE
ncbi:hypothetical protein C8F04DRAFT_1033823 [Mycena alexandri]|uniref:G-patch domain-containing protein n=1 Tax=Mycena alexandri TaxID=1745969 RepID=A0AAD6X752_9AGAR|nr:hypothetical protein C8F04DRAFT_1033823 [Mycena alexandri]